MARQMNDLERASLKEFNEILENSFRTSEVFQAKVGWEIADGEFIWDMGKKFNNKFDAQQWVNSLLKAGNFDAGQVENIK